MDFLPIKLPDQPRLRFGSFLSAVQLPKTRGVGPVKQLEYLIVAFIYRTVL